MNRRFTMVQQAKEYLQQRRSMGFALESQGYLLLKFAESLDRSGHRGPLTTDAALRWVNLPKAASRNYRARRLSVVRCFARYLAVRDGRSEVPGRNLIAKLSFHQRPHLYSQQELEQLLEAAGRLLPTYPLRRLTYQTLFGLLACTGLRVSEALRLTCALVDLDRGVLRIEKTTFKKGIGLPGRVLESGKPAWIKDVTVDSNFPRAKMVDDIGVKGAFAFPVWAQAKVVAVLEFFDEEQGEPDESLLQTVTHIGSQLGRLYERERAATSLREARDVAQEATRAKDMFLAAMS
ncbi:MAG: GAF domain-containing protein, partial [Planctomycetes bacterium]|nr:GAF domain-containing protein [Planctomycetota bacterium]